MLRAKLFKHGGSQAVRLPKEFRFEGAEVLIEKKGEKVVLRPLPKIKTLADLARHMRGCFENAPEFPVREQPEKQQQRSLQLD